MASHKFFTAFDEHRMISHTRGRERTCVYAQRLKRFITRDFSSQLNRILKTEPVQSRNRFCRIRYSEMDIPIENIGHLSIVIIFQLRFSRENEVDNAGLSF